MAKQMLAEKGIDVKVVTTLHGTDITLVGSHPTYKAAVEFSINKSDAVTVVSNNLKKDTLRLFNINIDIEVIYNFINLKKYPEIEHSECNRSALAAEGEKIIAHVSNMREVKRPLDVVEIFYKIQKEVPSKLLLVGEGPEIEKVEQRVKDLGIYEKVIFMGNSNDVNKILCYSDIFLLPSITESFGLAALEAMAAKTAVISTNTGGLPEVNIEGVTGYLSDLGNIDEMAANAILLLKNEALLNTIKKNGLEQARSFSLDEILPQYENIYRKARAVVAN
jgi:N-acetyl-alpha-D-glucosaminyl L-malate synthase BshA